MHHNKPFAEVIESSLKSWKARCWQWDIMPAYGSLLTIKSQNRTYFAIVHEIATVSQDNHRTVFAYRKTEEELKRDHPHIFELINTEFTCLTLGYSQNDDFFYQMAPEPPKIHAFITYPTHEELINFFMSDYYLHTLFLHQNELFSLDDLLLALFKHMGQLTVLTHERFNRAIDTYSLLTGNDYRRLKLFLQRAQSFMDDRKRTSTHTMSALQDGSHNRLRQTTKSEDSDSLYKSPFIE